MSKITSKGQVTIPKAIRDELGLLPGAEVEFISGDGEVRVRKSPHANRRRAEEAVRHLQESGKDFTMTTDEIMRLTRGEDWGRGT
ncbi:MAG TPA: AbrB/MazE/SpoVT family DNA-binding domain-containing protein [Solirubrobacterales bacterium]|nr:AbrB/MazE/SpoVT family DNA-binding domain-containing protein [Solirubrobacterales bacterium]